MPAGRSPSDPPPGPRATERLQPGAPRNLPGPETAHLADTEPIVWRPAPGITVQVRSFSCFLATLSRPGRLDCFASARPVLFSADDFIRPFLSPSELAQVNRFKSLKKQVEWMAARSLAKEMVTRRLPDPIPRQAVEIAHRDEGAPYLPDYPDLGLSISHAGRYAAVALGHGGNRQMGVDLEKIAAPPGPGFMKLAFTPLERAALGNDPVPIFRNWTLKEAFLKYIQRGFNESLHHVELRGNTLWHRARKSEVDLFTAIIGRDHYLSLVRGR